MCQQEMSDSQCVLRLDFGILAPAITETKNSNAISHQHLQLGLSWALAFFWILIVQCEWTAKLILMKGI